jgi:hypothetical protein
MRGATLTAGGTQPGMAGQRPDTGSILVIAGGFFLLFAGALVWLVGATCISHGPGPAQGCAQVTLVGPLFLGVAALSILIGMMLRRFAEQHVMLGGVVIAVAVLPNVLGLILGGRSYADILTNFGAIPFLTLLIGAGFSIAWRPVPMSPFQGSPYWPAPAVSDRPPPPPPS